MIIKVCGMSDPENIRQVALLGINWMGFIFYERSPRYILKKEYSDLSTLKRIKASLKEYGIKTVGVFVNATIEQMMETATDYNLDYLQLHGEESADTCHTLQKRGYSLIKAFSIATEEDLATVSDYEGRVDYFLFDTKCKEYGGSGKQFDWSILSVYKGNTPFLLSGGITPESAEAIRNFSHPRFTGIDLNSKFETEPGMKDIEKLSHFLYQIYNL